MTDKKKIFVFCNSCSPEWHCVEALTEDGLLIAGHVCSSHCFIYHDMGFTSDWKHEVYDRYAPEGWELEYVENPMEHAGLDAAHKKHLAYNKDEYQKIIDKLKPDSASVKIEFSNEEETK